MLASGYLARTQLCGGFIVAHPDESDWVDAVDTHCLTLLVYCRVLSKDLCGIFLKIF